MVLSLPRIDNQIFTRMFSSMQSPIFSDTFSPEFTEIFGPGDSALPEFITFTRASSGTYFDADGILQTASSNEARITYPQDGSGRRGILIEEARTNLLTYHDLTSGWGANASASRDLDQSTSPDGTTNATHMTTGSSAVSGYYNGNLSVTLGDVWTFSVFLKHISGDATTLRPRLESGFTSAVLTIDLTDGSVSGVGVGVDSYKVVSLPNGWYRVELTATATSTSGASISIYDGDASNGGVFGVFGAQVEAGGFASSFIYVEGASTTRAVDLCSVQNIDSTHWFNSSEGALFISTQTNGWSEDYQTAFSIGNETTGHTIALRVRGDNEALEFNIAAAGTQTLSTMESPNVHNTYKKFVCGYKTNDVAACLNGGTVASDNTVTLPTMDTISIGSVGGASRSWNGIIFGLLYFPRRLLNDELVEITK